jgi:glycosyltransferase involved in cell wall biosynthesis
MIGQKGIPATWGGVEHHVEEIGARLAERGHRVTVYARSGYAEEPPPTHHRGMSVRHLPTVRTKHLDAIVHSALATADALRRGADVVHYHAIGPGVLSLAPRILSRAAVVLTVHGRDGQRAKWGSGARAALGAAEWLSARAPDATVVVSEDLERHYREAYGRAAVHIPNGVGRPVRRSPAEIVERWGLEPGRYLLFVGRLVPEKAPDLLVRAFRRIPEGLRLAIAGGSSYTDRYVRELEEAAARDPRVVMTGYVHGPVLDELYSNAAAFVLPSSLEGLPLTLLEAAAYGGPLVVSDIPPNLEVVRAEAPGRRVFRTGSEDSLVEAISRALADPTGERAAAEAFGEEVQARYRWDAAADATERLYVGLLRGRRRFRG